MRDPDLDRLLRAAAQQPEPAPDMPFGFDSRVLANARGEKLASGRDAWELVRLLRRTAVAAAVVILFSSSAAYWQFAQNDEAGEELTNAYAIADTAIEAELLP